MGDGTFQSAPISKSIWRLQLPREFTGDGKADLLLGDSNGVSLLLGGGLATDLTLTQSRAGVFTAGQAGVSYTITVTNTRELASTGLVSVTENLAPAFTATALGGSGWSCVLAMLTCQRTDVAGPARELSAYHRDL